MEQFRQYFSEILDVTGLHADGESPTVSHVHAAMGIGGADSERLISASRGIPDEQPPAPEPAPEPEPEPEPAPEPEPKLWL